eukprot:gene9995-13447_t
MENRNNSSNISNYYTLFLGDLSAFCTDDDIHELFSPYGNIAEIRIMKSKKTKLSLGYGFVRYFTLVDATNALNGMSNASLKGRKIQVCWSVDNPGNNLIKQTTKPTQQQPQKLKNNISSIVDCEVSIYCKFDSVENVKFVIDESYLEDLFTSSDGVLVSVSIKQFTKNSYTGKQYGYAFIHFVNDERGVREALSVMQNCQDLVVAGVKYHCSLSKSLKSYLELKQRSGLSPFIERGLQNEALLSDHYYLKSMSMGNISTSVNDQIMSDSHPSYRSDSSSLYEISRFKSSGLDSTWNISSDNYEMKQQNVLQSRFHSSFESTDCITSNSSDSRDYITSHTGYHNSTETIKREKSIDQYQNMTNDYQSHLSNFGILDSYGHSSTVSTTQMGEYNHLQNQSTVLSRPIGDYTMYDSFNSVLSMNDHSSTISTTQMRENNHFQDQSTVLSRPIGDNQNNRFQSGPNNTNFPQNNINFTIKTNEIDVINPYQYFSRKISTTCPPPLHCENATSFSSHQMPIIVKDNQKQSFIGKPKNDNNSASDESSISSISTYL